jgi:hypothetical protein
MCAGFLGGRNLGSALRGLEQGFEEGGVLGLEGGAVVGPTGAGVPVIGVPVDALLAMEIGVDRHTLFGGERIDQGVGLRPVAFGVPPESGERRGEIGGRGGSSERGLEFGGSHGPGIVRQILWQLPGLGCCGRKTTTEILTLRVRMTNWKQ